MAVSKRTRIIIGVVAVLAIGGVVAFNVTKDHRVGLVRHIAA